jgi:hypothetical protein
MLPAQMHNFLKKVCLLPLTSGKHPESFSLAGKGEILDVSIIDGLGRECPLTSGEGINTDHKLDISGLKPGLYWVKIKTSKGVAVERLVKK